MMKEMRSATSRQEAVTRAHGRNRRMVALVVAALGLRYAVGQDLKN